MNSINENIITCEYINTRGQFINQRCKVQKTFCDGLCKIHYTRKMKKENKKENKKEDKKENKKEENPTNNIIFKLKEIIKEYNIDTIELKNILNIIEEEEPEPEPKPKIIEKPKPKIIIEEEENEYIIEDDDEPIIKEKLPPITDEIKTKTKNYLQKTDKKSCSLYATAIAFNKDAEYIQKLYEENGREKHDGTSFNTIKKVVNILSNNAEVLSDFYEEKCEKYKIIDENKTCCRTKSLFNHQCGRIEYETCRYCNEDYNCIKKNILKTKQTEKQFIKNNPTGRFLVSYIGHTFVIDNGVFYNYNKSSGRRKITNIIKIQ